MAESKEVVQFHAVAKIFHLESMGFGKRVCQVTFEFQAYDEAVPKPVFVGGHYKVTMEPETIGFEGLHLDETLGEEA